jgi:hypothetical protein
MKGSARLVTVAALGILALAGCATTNRTAASPEDTVRRFAQLDFEGARLSGSTYDKINPLVTWKEQKDTDPVFVVTGYEVAGSKVEGDRAEVTVEYAIVDRLDVPWKPGKPDKAQDIRENTNVTFQLLRKGGTWRIDSPAMTPHVSPEAIARVIRTWPQMGYNGYDYRLDPTLEYLDSLKSKP